MEATPTEPESNTTKQENEEPLVIRRPIKKNAKEEQNKIDDKNDTAKKYPPIPTTAKGKQHYETLKKFVDDDTVTLFEFPATLGNEDRKIIHPLADEFGLLHYSRGTKVRYLTIEKKNNVKEDEFQLFGYVGLLGPSVDRSVDGDEMVKQIVPAVHIQKRIKRDGPISHITIINGRDEVKKITENWESLKKTFPSIEQFEAKYSENLQNKRMEILMDLISQEVENDWKDLGIGRVIQNKNEAWFKVVEWPSATEFRRKVDVPPKDFHITIGYAFSDIHNVRKDKSTLINVEEELKKKKTEVSPSVKRVEGGNDEVHRRNKKKKGKVVENSSTGKDESVAMDT